jgi:dihydroceramidase
MQFVVFHLSFGSLEAFALFRVYLLYRATEIARVRRLFRLGMSSYLGAVAIWFIDLRYCHFLSVTLPSYGIPNPELHAVWHVLVSFGFYLLVVLVAEERLAALRAGPPLES